MHEGLSRGVARPSPRHRQLTAVALLGVLWAAGGCGGTLVGQWRVIRSVPNPDVVAFHDLTFRGDDTYSAKVTIDGHTADEQGAYAFNGFKLTLMPRAGGARSYDAALRFTYLDLIQGERKVYLEKK